MMERIYEETNSGKIIPKGELVRCKDCKYYHAYECENDYVLRRIRDCGCNPPFDVDPDWFCADGERRET